MKEHLSVALAAAEDDVLKYHIREAYQKCIAKETINADQTIDDRPKSNAERPIKLLLKNTTDETGSEG
jgi:hypothetical protein